MAIAMGPLRKKGPVYDPGERTKMGSHHDTRILALKQAMVYYNLIRDRVNQSTWFTHSELLSDLGSRSPLWS